MTTRRAPVAWCIVAVLAFCAPCWAGAQDGDVAISGTLRYQALHEVGSDPPTGHEVSTQRYIFEVPADVDTIGVPQPLDVDLVKSLCRDKEGCQITLQMVNWDQDTEPGAVASRTGRLFLSETTSQFRFDEGIESGLKGVDGATTNVVTWRLYDCAFTDADTPGFSGPNTMIDQLEGFALLNCSDNFTPPTGTATFCGFSDVTTVCRVVIAD